MQPRVKAKELYSGWLLTSYHRSSHGISELLGIKTKYVTHLRYLGENVITWTTDLKL